MVETRWQSTTYIGFGHLAGWIRVVGGLDDSDKLSALKNQGWSSDVTGELGVADVVGLTIPISLDILKAYIQIIEYNWYLMVT